MENIQPPINELISFNVGGLQTFLTFLSEANKKLNSDISIIATETTNVKKTFKDVSSKTERLETKVTNTENSLFSIQAKFADLENKIVSTLKRGDDGHSLVMNKLNIYEDSLNKLNRLTEENIKSISKVDITLESFMKETADRDSKIIDYVSRLDKQEKSINELAEKYDKIKNSLEEEFNKVKAKITDSDVRILKVSETINNVVPGTPDIRSVGAGGRRLSYVGGASQFGFPIGQDRDNNPNSSNNLILVEIAKLNKEIESLKKKNKDNDDIISSLSRNNEELIERVTKLKPTDEHCLQTTPTNTTSNARSLIRTNTLHTDNNVISETLIVQNKSLAENFTKINDNVKSLLINVNLKVNKEEFNNFSHSVNNEFDKFSQLYTENFKSIDLRIQNLITASKMLSSNPSVGNTPSGNIIINKPGEPNANPAELEEVVTKISKNVINSELSENKKIIENFLQTNTFLDIKTKMDQNKEEIDKLYDSIVDIRKNYLDTKKDDESDTVVVIKPRLQNIENNISRMRNQIEEMSRNVDNEFEAHLKENGDTSNIRDFVRNIGGGMKNLSEKVETVINKQTNLNQEIILRVKKDLTNESNRILEDFRSNLKQSIGMIEDKLKEKVDRFGLDEFGRKIDNKFHNQMNKKIDITDLRKNNNLIVKKIDTLENKISKTLVDTLIDLQMEEAPLIVKKSLNGEKCASCNQIIHSKEHLNHINFYHSTDLQFSEKYLRQPLMTPKPLDTEERVEKFSKTNFSLPEVRKKKPGILKTDEQVEKELNIIIESELEKCVVNPDNLIKTTNKLFNKFEKKIK
jgi:chromosome segregation ATPase